MSLQTASAAQDITKKLRSVFSLVLFFFLVGALLYCDVSFAQTGTATLSGTIMDTSGGVVAGAEVHVTNVDTNAEVTTKTNSSGIYVIAALKPGLYRMFVSKLGFKQVTL